jgi:hypothetical protein
MHSPFPGMDPYLENKEIWPDSHDRLVGALCDELSVRIAPKYLARLNRRAYLLDADDLESIGLPDVALVSRKRMRSPVESPPVLVPAGGPTMLEVELPFQGEVSENYLEIRTARGHLVTTIEVLSPVNKLHSKGRVEYESKRNQIIGSMTNLIEIDLLRDGRPLPVIGPKAKGDYRILVSRGFHRPTAQLFVFGVRDAIPSFLVPLGLEDEEPSIDLNRILHRLYDVARYDLEIDYSAPAAPPLSVDDAEWARSLVA